MIEEEIVKALGAIFIIAVVLAIIGFFVGVFGSNKKKDPNKITSETFKKNKFDNFVGMEIECLKKKRGE